MKSSKTIPFAQIAAVSIKKPSLLTAGYLQIQTIGNANRILSTPMSIAGDENSVMFGKEEYEIAIAIKAAIEKKFGL